MTTGKLIVGEMVEASVNLDFPFVENLPKREKSRLQKFWDAWNQAKAMLAEKGDVMPATLAAKLCDISKQRIFDLMEKGKLERVEINGHVFVTEASLLAWLNEPENKGGRPRKDGIKHDKRGLWKVSAEWAKETMGVGKKK